jgi:hypothetical protein
MCRLHQLSTLSVTTTTTMVLYCHNLSLGLDVMPTHTGARNFPDGKESHTLLISSSSSCTQYPMLRIKLKIVFYRLHVVVKVQPEIISLIKHPKNKIKGFPLCAIDFCIMTEATRKSSRHTVNHLRPLIYRELPSDATEDMSGPEDDDDDSSIEVMSEGGQWEKISSRTPEASQTSIAAIKYIDEPPKIVQGNCSINTRSSTQGNSTEKIETTQSVNNRTDGETCMDKKPTAKIFPTKHKINEADVDVSDSCDNHTDYNAKKQRHFTSIDTPTSKRDLGFNSKGLEYSKKRTIRREAKINSTGTNRSSPTKSGSNDNGNVAAIYVQQVCSSGNGRSHHSNEDGESMEDIRRRKALIELRLLETEDKRKAFEYKMIRYDEYEKFRTKNMSNEQIKRKFPELHEFCSDGEDNANNLEE